MRMWAGVGRGQWDRGAEQRAVRNSRLEEYTRARLERKRKQEIREADGKQYDRG